MSEIETNSLQQLRLTKRQFELPRHKGINTELMTQLQCVKLAAAERTHGLAVKLAQTFLIIEHEKDETC